MRWGSECTGIKFTRHCRDQILLINTLHGNKACRVLPLLMLDDGVDIADPPIPL
jgi:hypothetical protein